LVGDSRTFVSQKSMMRVMYSLSFGSKVSISGE
jgi:hypothetical protein